MLIHVSLIMLCMCFGKCGSAGVSILHQSMLNPSGNCLDSWLWVHLILNHLSRCVYTFAVSAATDLYFLFLNFTFHSPQPDLLYCMYVCCKCNDMWLPHTHTSTHFLSASYICKSFVSRLWKHVFWL